MRKTLYFYRNQSQITMTVNRVLISFLLTAFIVNSCSNQKESHISSVTVKITDEKGIELPFYSLQVIDIKDCWLGTPRTSKEGGKEKPITIQFRKDEPAILKFGAPGYQPKFTFLPPGSGSFDLEVTLRSPVLLDDPNPVIVGDFNDFDPRKGIQMAKQPEGIWTAEIESDRDTIH